MDNIGKIYFDMEEVDDSFDVISSLFPAEDLPTLTVAEIIMAYEESANEAEEDDDEIEMPEWEFDNEDGETLVLTTEENLDDMEDDYISLVVSADMNGTTHERRLEYEFIEE